MEWRIELEVFPQRNHVYIIFRKLILQWTWVSEPLCTVPLSCIALGFGDSLPPASSSFLQLPPAPSSALDQHHLLRLKMNLQWGTKLSLSACQKHNSSLGWNHGKFCCATCWQSWGGDFSGANHCSQHLVMAVASALSCLVCSRQGAACLWNSASPACLWHPPRESCQFGGGTATSQRWDSAGIGQEVCWQTGAPHWRQGAHRWRPPTASSTSKGKGAGNCWILQLWLHFLLS